MKSKRQRPPDHEELCSKTTNVPSGSYNFYKINECFAIPRDVVEFLRSCNFAARPGITLNCMITRSGKLLIRSSNKYNVVGRRLRESRSRRKPARQQASEYRVPSVRRVARRLELPRRARKVLNLGKIAGSIFLTRVRKTRLETYTTTVVGELARRK